MTREVTNRGWIEEISEKYQALAELDAENELLPLVVFEQGRIRATEIFWRKFGGASDGAAWHSYQRALDKEIRNYKTRERCLFD